MALSVAGCPKRQTRRIGAPKMSLPTSGDSEARARFKRSQALFEQDASQANVEEFESIIRDYPEDPIVPHALLYAGMAAFRHGDAAKTLEQMDELSKHSVQDQMLVARGRLYRGLALVALGRSAEAISDLEAGRGAAHRGDASEQGWMQAGLAEGYAKAGKAGPAIRAYDAWWQVATGSEKDYCRDQIEALSSGVDEARLAPLYQGLAAGVDGPGLAFVGARYGNRLRDAGSAESAQAVFDRIAAVQQSLGLLSEGGLASGGGNTAILGAFLPMTGRLNKVGELSMRGLALASGHFGMAIGDGQELPQDLITMDSRSTPSSASEGIEELVVKDAIAVVGPFDGKGSRSAARAAQRAGMPLLSLAPRGEAAASAFHMRHSAEERARSLARHAIAQGVRDVAIFGPKSSYGSIVGDAFADEIQKLGGAVVVRVSYPRGATSFKNEMRELKKPWSAIFIPDQARSLALIAPALAAANLNARPKGEKAKHGRSITLLSTAEGIDDGFLRQAGRYAWGAVFAPGFYADRTDELIADFVASYEDQYGAVPSAHEAYAYDAARLVQEAISRGASDRGSVMAALREMEMEGLTGAIRFGPDGRRADPGLLFQVIQPRAEQFELRAQR